MGAGTRERQESDANSRAHNGRAAPGRPVLKKRYIISTDVFYFFSRSSRKAAEPPPALET